MQSYPISFYDAFLDGGEILYQYVWFYVTMELSVCNLYGPTQKKILITKVASKSQHTIFISKNSCPHLDKFDDLDKSWLVCISHII